MFHRSSVILPRITIPPNSRPAKRRAKLLFKRKLLHAAHVMGPTLVALAFAGVSNGVAHAQGTMDFSGAQTLMGTFNNFPISFFDSPVPRWPTFGTRLQPTAANPQDTAADLVSMAQPNRVAPLTWNNLGDPVWTPTGVTKSRDAFDCIARFANAIINTMQNWRDNLQAVAPGFRGRIVAIKLRPDEGGLNLNMPKELIDDLASRGALAGQKLNTEFQFPSHMFIRFRTMLAALQQYLRQFNDTMSSPVPVQDELGIQNIRGVKTPDYYDWPIAYAVGVVPSMQSH